MVDFELKNVNSYYGDAQILFDVSLRIEKGEVAALFGRNGVGKTTTFRTIMGLSSPRYEGDILYQQENIRDLPAFRIARKGIGCRRTARFSRISRFGAT